MAREVLVMPSHDGTYAWCERGGVGPGEGSAAELARCIGRVGVTVCLPADSIGSSEVRIPARSRAQAEQAAPYVIEDEIVGDVDALQIGLGGDGRATPHVVAWVERAAVQAALTPLHEAGITIDHVISNALALPLPKSGTWQAVQRGDALIVRHAALLGFGCETALAEAIVERLPDSERPSRIELVRIDDHAPAFAPAGIEIDVALADRPFIEQLADTWDGNTEPDLAGGGARSEGATPRIRIAAAVLVALALVLHGGSLWWAASELEAQVENLRHTQKTLFSESFPDVRRIVDPLAQARQIVGEAEANGNNGPGFLEQLFHVARERERAGNGGIEFRTLGYAEGVMNLTLDADSVEGVERFGDTLGAQILSAEYREERVVSRMRVGEE